MKTTKMSNLFTKLDKTLNEVMSGSMEPADAREIANLAGKAINTARTEIEYACAKQRLGKALDIQACEPCPRE